MFIIPAFIPILANTALPWWLILLEFTAFLAPVIFIPIFLIELLIFWIFINRKSKKHVTASLSAIIIFVSNVITTLFGVIIIALLGQIFYEAYNYGFSNTFFTGGGWYLFIVATIIFWVITSLIEWGIYYMFLNKKGISKWYLLEISLIVNSISYFAISAIIPVWDFPI